MEWLKQTNSRLFYLINTLFHLKLSATLRHYWQQFSFKLSCCDLCGNSPDQTLINSSTATPLLCHYCHQDLPLFDQKIVQGDLLNWPRINQGLANIHFDHLCCIAPYLSPFDQWLPQFKYQGRFELAELFAELMHQQWQKAIIDLTPFTKIEPLVLSVPLHISKWQTRGYNQAHLIAKKFAQKSQYSYQAHLLQRKEKHNSQVGQTGTMRRKNLANAFTIDADFIWPEHVILIDDVVTTGSTASEISRLLKQAGVTTVTVVAVCLSLPK